jgi:hypothetical protein
MPGVQRRQAPAGRSEGLCGGSPRTTARRFLHFGRSSGGWPTSARLLNRVGLSHWGGAMRHLPKSAETFSVRLDFPSSLRDRLEFAASDARLSLASWARLALEMLVHFKRVTTSEIVTEAERRIRDSKADRKGTSRLRSRGRVR